MGDLHRLEQLHQPLALQHARDGRRGEAEMASEVSLRGAGTFQSVMKPIRIHRLNCDIDNESSR